MNPIVARQSEVLKELYPGASAAELEGGSCLITIPEFPLPPGWSRETTTVLFRAPPGYPGAQPDCFWVQPGQFRLANQETPQGSNDSNPIPGLPSQGNLTWFSWHVQRWNPNTDSLVTFSRVIRKRFEAQQ